VIFRGSRHVADPCDFTDEELTGYWTDVRTTAKAIERAYQPCQLNYTTFGRLAGVSAFQTSRRAA
jgi:diadenosine tetraphosphate (Ap4A) HIT family hydrolase